MFIQKLELAPMAMVAWTAMLLEFTLTAPMAVSADFEKAKAALEREDYLVALSELLPLAEQGHADAQIYLAMMYHRGNGVAQDHVLAAQWTRKAAELGLAKAQRQLGSLYYSGVGVPLDHALAAQWFRNAAEQGHAIAQTDLGIMYQYGMGVPLDHALAAQWFRNAAEQGYAVAQTRLGLLYYDGDEGVPQDYVFAYAWTNLAAAQGIEVARRLRDESLRLAMTSGQIAEAQALSRDFRGRTQRADTTTPPNRLEPVRLDRRPTGSASGFLVEPGGKVLTNNHGSSAEPVGKLV